MGTELYRNGIVKFSIAIIIILLSLVLSIHFFNTIVLQILIPFCALTTYLLIWMIHEFFIYRRESTDVLIETRNQLRSDIKEIQKIRLKEEIPVGAMGIYLNYKTLFVDDFAKLTASIQRMYNILYSIKVDLLEEKNISNFDFLSDELERIFKLNPEDRLLIHTINTGDSITIRFKSGWKPGIDTKENEIILYLPKGLTVLAFMAILLSKTFDYGITRYEQILNIIKTQREISIKDKEIEKINLEISDLKEKLHKVPNGIKEDLQKQLEVIHNLTIRNENIICVEIEKDKNVKILEKSFKSNY